MMEFSEMKSLFFQTLFLLMIGLSLMNTGCSTLRSWIGYDEKAVAIKVDDSSLTKFSDNPQVLNPSNRNYRKMTRSRMEDESDLGSQAGSMWVMEGQGAYLFSQNKSRREGDLLNVKVEGAAQKQIETKVSVIKKLLKQLEEEELKAREPAPPAMADNNPNPKKVEAQREPAAEKKDEKDEALEIGAVPTRIVERLPDGNYRIKGAHPFMIGKRDYKVIVTGLIRPEDFNDEGVSSNKILDPQFDVVSLRRSQK
jgi:flagellar L-ring protein precursor FlgH